MVDSPWNYPVLDFSQYSTVLQVESTREQQRGGVSLKMHLYFCIILDQKLIYVNSFDYVTIILLLYTRIGIRNEKSKGNNSV